MTTVDITRRSQEAVNTAVSLWSDTVRSAASSLSSGQAGLPDPTAFVDEIFDVSEKLLSVQRTLTQQWLSSAQKVTEAVIQQAAQAAESAGTDSLTEAKAVADTVAEGGKQLTRVVNEAGAAATPASDGNREA